MIKAHREYLLGPGGGGALATKISNFGATAGALLIGGAHVPFTRRDGSAGPVCSAGSPATALGYSGDISRPGAKLNFHEYTGSAMSRFAGRLVEKSGADSALILHNTPFSINVLDLSTDEIEALASIDLTALGARTIAVRGLVDAIDGAVITRLGEAGFVLIPYRRVYLVDAGAEDFKFKRDTRRDLRLPEKRGLTVRKEMEFTAAEYAIMAEQYDALYRRKYSLLNAAVTAAFFSDCAQYALSHFLAVRDQEGRLLGFTTYCETDTLLTTQFCGYDVEASAKVPIYRMFMAALVKIARDKRKLMNWGGGVPDFKRNRGAEPATEYFAFKTTHRATALTLGVFKRAYTHIAGNQRLLNKLGV